MNLIAYLTLPRQISEFERHYLSRMNRVALWFFLAHPPVLAAVAWLAGTNVLQAFLFGSAAVLGPVIAQRAFASPRVVSLVFGFTSMTVGALLVHFGKGPMQIEMHFYFFVSLALLAVFANPMVIIVAALTVVVHHLAFFFFLPSSVFNYEASVWSVMVHAVFVVVESVAGCFVARSFFDNVVGLEKIVATRTEELRHATEGRKKIEALVAENRVRNARTAGMAEVASGVLHNVGNALNSVNVSVSMISERLRASKLGGLAKATALIKSNSATLASFLTENPKGQRLPDYLEKLALQLAQDERAMINELTGLQAGVAHITAIVGAQQTLAKSGTAVETTEPVTPQAVVEEALRLALLAPDREALNVVTRFEPAPPLQLDRHRLIQILVNLIRNANQAMQQKASSERTLSLSTSTHDGKLRFVVRDTGIGISPETRLKIFSHGFTTRSDGHGFGMHASACTAMEMHGTLDCHSDGLGHGAIFTIEVPLDVRDAPMHGLTQEAA